MTDNNSFENGSFDDVSQKNSPDKPEVKTTEKDFVPEPLPESSIEETLSDKEIKKQQILNQFKSSVKEHKAKKKAEKLTQIKKLRTEIKKSDVPENTETENVSPIEVTNSAKEVPYDENIFDVEFEKEPETKPLSKKEKIEQSYQNLLNKEKEKEAKKSINDFLDQQEAPKIDLYKQLFCLHTFCTHHNNLIGCFSIQGAMR